MKKELTEKLAYEMRRVRECKNSLQDYAELKKYPNTEWFLQKWLTEHQAEADKLAKQLNWLKKPRNAGGALDIQRAKATPLTEILEFKRNKAKCPWHGPDNHPSLQYYPKVNKCWCFVCNKGGDAIDLAQALWNLTFKEAVKKLT